MAREEQGCEAANWNPVKNKEKSRIDMLESLCKDDHVRVLQTRKGFQIGGSGSDGIQGASHIPVEATGHILSNKNNV